ncbi:Kelch-like protein 7 [Taenia solium]|eukprot:TsM_000271500 transcript=TsM_000271500 gene=TsM_000271500
MAETDSITYGNEETRWVGCFRFEDLRRRGKLLDLKIVTRECQEISAHRVVLAVRFPRMEKELPAEANNCLTLTRFSADIVEAALSYAYTGVVKINRNNVLRLFLLAITLGCDIMMDWCVEFLSSRLSVDNVAEVWAVANSTLHERLLTLCLPIIRIHFEKLVTNPVFSAFMEPKGMAIILSDPLVESKKEGEVEVDILKQWAICCWLDNSRPAEPSNYRVDRFQRLICSLNLKVLSLDILSIIRDMATELDALNEKEQIEDALRGLGSILTQRTAASSASLWRGDVLAYGFFDKSRRNRIVKSIPELEGGSDVRFTLPCREGSAVVFVQNWIFTIGGGNPFGSSEVDMLNLDTGELIKGPRMRVARTLHAAVATNSLIFVFGSSNIKNKESFSSCEVFDLVNVRWSSLPNMLTACNSSVAVAVPGEGVLVAGGFSNGFNNTDAQLLCGNVEGAVDQEWSWRHLPPMLQARRSPSGAYFNGHVFVAGGNLKGFLDIENLCLPQKENAIGSGIVMMYLPEQDETKVCTSDAELKESTGSGIASAFRKPFLIAKKWGRLPDLESTKWPHILTRWLPSSPVPSAPENEPASENHSE